jgi:hypothetical protein
MDGPDRPVFDESGRYQGRSEDDRRPQGFVARLKYDFGWWVAGWVLFGLVVIVFLICVACTA